MGYNCYVNNALLPTVRMMQEAYKNGMVSLTDLHLGILDIIGGDNGNHGDHQNGDHHKEESRNEEKLPPCTPFSKEEKKKEERGSHTPRKREILPIPTLDEVREFAKQIPDIDFTAEYFFHKNESRGWQNDGKTIENWQSLMLSWHEGKKGKGAGVKPSQQRQQALLAAETRMQEKAERQMAEREERLKRQAEESVSWAEYLRMKQEGKV